MEVPHDELADDLDELDSTGIDFGEEQVSDEDLALVALNPENDPAKAAAYKELFGG